MNSLNIAELEKQRYLFPACLKCDKDHNNGDITLANQNTCQENNPAPCHGGCLRKITPLKGIVLTLEYCKIGTIRLSFKV